MARMMSILCVTGTVVLLQIVSLASSQATECRDRHDSCPTWAERGECYTNRGYMWIHCAESCHQCVVQDENCKDIHEQCPAWASNGECQRNYVYMRKSCPRSCTFCMPANDYKGPHVHSNLVDSHWDRYNNKFPTLARNHN